MSTRRVEVMTPNAIRVSKSANPEAHYQTTGPIWKQTEGKIISLQDWEPVEP
jgi:cysteine synthase